GVRSRLEEVRAALGSDHPGPAYGAGVTRTRIGAQRVRMAVGRPTSLPRAGYRLRASDFRPTTRAQKRAAGYRLWASGQQRVSASPKPKAQSLKPNYVFNTVCTYAGFNGRRRADLPVAS